MHYFLALLSLVIALSVSPAARADKRVALVVGNSAYQNAPELSNPRNDSSDITASLTKLGFQVLEGRDLDKRTMERMIRQFGSMLAGADVALFFYGGHGIQVNGQNYLVPTDARLASEADVDFETLPLSLVLKQMEREAKTTLILLDACRDNPLAKNLARSMGTRSTQVGSGLAEVKTGVGTLIGFSTQPGNIAADGVGRNSPYAGALLRHIEEPGKDVSAILVAVRNDVLKETNGNQVPWEHTSLTGQVYFSFDATVSLTESAPPVAHDRNYDKEMEIAFWNAVKDTKVPGVLQTYLDRFPQGTFAALARIMIEQLRTPTAAPAIISKQLQSEPPKPAEAVSSDPLALTRALQTELKRVGCDPGAVDGVWGRKAEEALSNFARTTKTALTTGEATQSALQAVAGHKSRVCALSCDSDEVAVDGKCVAKAKPRRKPAVAEAPRRRATRSSSEDSPAPGRLCFTNETRGSVGVCH